MKIKYELVNKIKKEISIVEVIQQHLNLNKKGNNWFGCCPFHNEKTASFCVNESKKIFSCFSCHVHGDVFSFLSKINNISYSRAILEAAKFSNLDKSIINELNNYNEAESKLQYIYDINELANKYFQMFLRNKKNHNALDYLYNRGLNDDIIKRFEIGFAPDDSTIMIDLLTNKNNMVPGAKNYKLEELKNAGIVTLLDNGDYISFFKNRIIFPIYNQDHQLVAFSGRTIDADNEPKYLNTSQTAVFNKNEVLYNFDKLKNNAEEYSLYLVEGFMDVIAMYSGGFNNAVATMGVTFSENHLNQLKYLSELSYVVMAFDNDRAGFVAMEKTATLISQNYDVYMIDYIDKQYKDLDELLQKNKPLFDETVNNIIYYYDYEIRNLLENKVIKNILDKEHLIKNLTTILSKYKKEDLLLEQVGIISTKLDIDQSILLKKLPFHNNEATKKVPNKNNKKNQISDSIELNANKKAKIQLVRYTEQTEIVIIECCILSRDAWELFFAKVGAFLLPENITILNLIDNFYTKNVDKEFISLSDIKAMTNDLEQLAFLSNMFIEIEKRKLVYAQKKLLDTIDTHLKQMHKYYWDINCDNVINAKSDDERQKYQDRLDKLIANKINNSKKIK